MILTFSMISQNCFIGKVMIRSMNHGTTTGSRSIVDSRPWGGTATLGLGRSSWYLRKRKEVVGVLTNDATWRQSCRDHHTTALNRGGRWCSDGEIVLGVRRRGWSRGGCGFILGVFSSCDCFQRGRGGGGETDPRCWRWMKNRRRRSEEGWMRANQNSSIELGLYPKVDSMSLSYNSTKTAQL
jgi:hypothetical protein